MNESMNERNAVGPIHQAFELQHIIDKQLGTKQPLYLCLVDLKAAYDKVQWPLIWQVLERLGIHGSMLCAIKSVYSGCLLAMKMNNAHGDTQCPSIGLRQGCPLSATVFGLFLDGLHNHLQQSVPGAGIQVQDLKITDTEYADDVMLLGSTPAQLQILINAMTHYCEALHMQISAAKTKVMVLGGERGHTFTYTDHIHHQSSVLEQVSSFKYLGLNFEESCRIHHMIKPALDKAIAAWAIVQNKHANLHLGDTVNLKFHLFRSILIPTFHYGCEVWGMHSPRDPAAKQARCHLEQKYMFFLKRICGLQSTTANAVIHAETNMSSLESFWWKQSIQFWNLLASAPERSFHRSVLLDNLADSRRGIPHFSYSVSHCLKSIGISICSQSKNCPFH